jgi:guanylate kinase
MGSINIKQQDKKNTIAFFINPPSLETLEKRLKYRNTDSSENINKRLRKAKMELSYASKFDHVLVNDNLKTLLKQAEQLIKVFLKS